MDSRGAEDDPVKSMMHWTDSAPVTGPHSAHVALASCFWGAGGKVSEMHRALSPARF